MSRLVENEAKREMGGKFWVTCVRMLFVTQRHWGGPLGGTVKVVMRITLGTSGGKLKLFVVYIL